jgi:hypothetical protein
MDTILDKYVFCPVPIEISFRTNLLATAVFQQVYISY